MLGETSDEGEFLAWHDGLPDVARAALAGAAADWADDTAAESQIRAALAVAPGHLAVRVGAYKFYFYKHRLPEAAPHALWCVGWASARLGLPADWRRLSAAAVAGAGPEPLLRFLLFSLKAYGYVMVRQGALAEGRAAVARVVDLDPDDRVGAGRLLTVIDRGGVVD
ncbi:MAG: hypothetical protein WCO00_04830 [Rhodospirillaceae bacterium]